MRLCISQTGRQDIRRAAQLPLGHTTYLDVLLEEALGGELLVADVADDHRQVVHLLVLAEVARVAERLVAQVALVQRQVAVFAHVPLIPVNKHSG